KPQPLTRNRFQDATPAYSPDGSTIVYAAAPDGQQFDLYEIPAEGGTPKQLTFTDDASEFDPYYAPDGTKIAFEVVKGKDSDIAYMDVGGSGEPIVLAGGPEFQEDPAFAPDSERVAFSSSTRTDSDLREVNINSPGETKQLTSGPARDLDPDYSGDGRIAFAR